MDTEEAIEFLDKKNRYVLPKTNLEREHNDDVDEVIKILQCDKKFEKMWEKLRNEILWSSMELENSVKLTMDTVENMYSPIR